MTETRTETRSLVIERELSHAPSKVWRALTQTDLIKEWLMQNDFDPTVGHTFQFRAEPVPGWNGLIDSEVLLVEPEKQLSYRWNSMGLDTVVVWTLTATADGTLLRMEQTGFRAEQENAYKGARYGWQKFMGNLERVVAGLQ